MEIHKLNQGTTEWNSFRSNHFGASEAAAMLGLSTYMSRSELMHLKATGEEKEHSEFTKKIFQNGHDVEAKARLLLEEELGDDLFPITCSEGNLSASVDGLTIDGSLAFEHKQPNNDLFSLVFYNQLVPDHYMAQCQQILMVTGADKVIFVCSDGTRDNWAEVDVLPDQSWFMRITQGWAQFQHDLKNYQPRELAEKPEPAAIMQLPALSIQIKGEVTVSNLPEFKQAAEKFIADINTDLKTDNDFANAEATVKFCGDTEDKLEAAKAAAIGQTASIDELMRTIDHIKESIRQKRLTLEKSVKTQKESIKTKIVLDGFNLCFSHATEVDLEFPQINFVQIAGSIFTRQNFETACKNKRTLASLHNAVDTEVAAIKIKLDDLARVIRKNLTHLPEDLSLFRDLQTIITKQEDDFKLLVESRLAEQKRKEEEAAQRAIAEAKAAEERGKAQAAAALERDRIAKENEERRTQEAKEAEAKRIAQETQAKASIEARNAELKRKEEEGRKNNEDHRKKIIRETIESLIDHGISSDDAEKLVQFIGNGKIKNVTLNF